MLEQLKAGMNALAARLRRMEGQHQAILSAYDAVMKILPARSITQEIDAIPGRRIYYNLTGRQLFDLTDAGRRGNPVNMPVSQDGPFIQTHYPFVSWRPTQPAGANMLGIWRPVTQWPLPLQFTSGAVDGDTDTISISYEIQDSGSQRNFQNEPVPPILSRPDNMVPLPVPTLFTPNTTVQFFPTYERILFDNAIPPTQGQIVVALPGYRIVNM